jgi:hypothetical protein
MKKKLLCGAAAVLLAVVCVLFFAGCPTETKEEEKAHTYWESETRGTDPAKPKATLKWYEDDTFSFDLRNSGIADIEVGGRFETVSVSADGKTCVYKLQGMGGAAASFNTIQVGISFTNDDKSRFSLTCNDPLDTLGMVSSLCGGFYTKK